MFLCFFSPLICSITLLAGLWIEDHTNKALIYSTYDERMLARGFISPSRCSLLSAHIIFNGDFTLFYLFPHLIKHTIAHMINCCMPVQILFWFEDPLPPLSISPPVLPCLHVFQFLWFFLNRCWGRFSMSKRFVGSLPPSPSISCTPKTPWKLMMYHLDASWRNSPE